QLPFNRRFVMTQKFRLSDRDWFYSGAVNPLNLELTVTTPRFWRSRINRIIFSAQFLGLADPKGVKSSGQMRFICMKKYIYLLIGAALFAACEQKETTVANPPAQKKESNTTIINPSPATTTKK